MGTHHNTQRPQKPKLLDQVRAAIRTLHYSRRTERAYVNWIRRFILFHNKRHPLEMADAEVNQFLTDLAVRGNIASSTQNQALAAILFLYKHVLGRELGRIEDVVRAKKPRRLPVILTADEVKAVLDHLEGVCRLVANGRTNGITFWPPAVVCFIAWLNRPYGWCACTVVIPYDGGPGPEQIACPDEPLCL